MKQHITESQLKELYTEDNTGTSSKRFKKLQNNFDGNFLYFTDYDELTIGKMIEILHNEYNYVDVLSKECEYEIMVRQYDFSDGMSFINFDELCDALWEAIKELVTISNPT